MEAVDYKTVEELSNEHLVSLSQKSNSYATEVLLLRYRNLIAKWVRKFYLKGSEFEDLLQEGYIGFLKAIRDYKHIENRNFLAFAFMCVRRHIISQLIKNNRKKNQGLNTAISIDRSYNEKYDMKLIEILPDKSCYSPEQLYIDQENSKYFLYFIDNNLTEFEIRVLSLRLKGISYKESADIMGVSKKGIDNALTRIKKKFRENYNRI